MTRQEVFDLLNSNPVFFLATMEGSQPRVRGMLLYRADSSGIIFHTGTMKDVFQQITKNARAEMCFNDFARNIQVRVSGELELVDDNNLKDEISEHPTREFLKDWKENGVLEDFYEILAVFRMRNGVATIWTLETNFEPKSKISL